MNIIEADNIGIMFKLRHEKRWTLKKSAMNIFKRKQPAQNFWALKKVGFKLKKGESAAMNPTRKLVRFSRIRALNLTAF